METSCLEAMFYLEAKEMELNMHVRRAGKQQIL